MDPSTGSGHGRDARTVLVVEDEPHIRDLVGLHLELEGWTPELVGDGHVALDRLRARPFDLVILDIMLPGLDGLTVLKALRRDSRNTDVPVLLLTARREESDKVLGLESGADDYLAKPFGVAELVARARALMRRPRASADPTLAGRPLTVRGLTVDPAKRRVTVGDRDVDLTSHEFELLFLLVSHPGVVYSREAVLARIWKGDTFVTERSVDALVKRLRRKVESDPGNPVYVLTVWGTGYKFADE
jgi:two-component system alkaline phosphatase synthesis response regulator PhoP